MIAFFERTKVGATRSRSFSTGSSCGGIYHNHAIVMRLEISGRLQPPVEHDMTGIYAVMAGFIPAMAAKDNFLTGFVLQQRETPVWCQSLPPRHMRA